MSEHEFRNDNGYMVRVFDLGGGITRVNEHRSVTDTRTFYVIDGEVWTVRDELVHKRADIGTSATVKGWVNQAS